MERKRFSVLFFIKRSKLLKNGEAPVRVRVTYDRLYVELQLKRSVKVPLWSQEKEKSTGKDRNSVELNHYIDALRVKFYQIYQDLELEEKIVSARAIVNRYQGKDETFKTLYNVFKEYNDNLETRMKQIPNIQLKLTPDLFFLKYKKTSYNQLISFRFVLGL
mgnify:FL=1